MGGINALLEHSSSKEEVLWLRSGLFPGVVCEGNLPVLQSQYDASDMVLQKDSRYFWDQCQKLLKTGFLFFT